MSIVRGTMPNVARTAFAALAFILTLGISNAAYAACSSPAGAEGEMIYNDDFNVLQFCDGTNWVGMSGGSGGGGGAGVTDGDKGDITVGSSGASWMIDDDVLDFTELSDAMTLDASTRITVTGSNVLTLTNTGTGASLVVEDQASDTTPFVVAADGKVGIGISSPTQALDVAGKATADSVIYKAVTSTAAPVTGSSMWSTNGTDVWRTSGLLGLGVANPSYPLHIVSSGASSVLRMDSYGTGFSSALNMTHARGTYGSGTATQSTDIIGTLGFIGNPLTGTAAKVMAVAEENFTASTGAASLRFNTRASGSTGSSAERMRITPDGLVGINTSTPTTTLDVNGVTHGMGFSANGSLPTDMWSISESMGFGASGTGSKTQGFVGHQGSHELDLFWNFYRNGTSSWAGVSANGYTSANGIRMGNSGILFVGTSTMATSMPATRVIIDNSGYVGIGATAPESPLHIVASPDVTLSGGGSIIIGATNTTNLAIDNNEIQSRNNGAAGSLAINSAGGTVTIGAGFAASTAPLQFAGNDTQFVASFHNTSTAAGTDGLAIRTGPNSITATTTTFLALYDGDGTAQGSITSTGSGGVAYNTTSDRRIKRNIVDTAQGIDTLMRVRVVDYNPMDSDKLLTGYIAQELYDVFPDAVTKPQDESKDYWTVDYGRVTPLIVKAVQDQQKEIIALKDQNAALLKRIEALEAKQ